MFETQRVILGGGMQVGERRVAGVAGLGKQGEIGQSELGGQFGARTVGDWLATVAGDGGHEWRQGQQTIDGRELRESVCCHGFHPDRAERS